MSIKEINKKVRFQQSATTTIRYKEPTSKLARFNTQFIADYSNQKAHIPDGKEDALIESTQGRKRNLMTLNRSGKAPVFGPMKDAFVGSSPDDPANY